MRALLEVFLQRRFGIHNWQLIFVPFGQLCEDNGLCCTKPAIEENSAVDSFHCVTQHRIPLTHSRQLFTLPYL